MKEIIFLESGLKKSVPTLMWRLYCLDWIVGWEDCCMSDMKTVSFDSQDCSCKYKDPF